MRHPLLASLVLGCSLLLGATAQAAPRDDFKVCWTIYAGWMPWGEAQAQGIIDKWAKKYGIHVEVVQLNDYVESINQYTTGQFDGCAMTNMDALTIPAAGGVDSTALIVSDYSNGNDGIVMKGKGKTLTDLKGQQVNLVQFSVSHYLLARALQSVGLSERDLTTVNTSDADMVAAFQTADVRNVVTWNPLLAEIKAQPDTTEVFDSTKIPGEILDMLVVNTATLKDNSALGKALTGAWFEMMALMKSGDAKGKAALEAMAKASGTDLAGFQAQLDKTRLFATPAEALAFVKDPALPTTMQRIAHFSFEHGLLGQGAPSAEAIGIAYPGGKTSGDAGNLKLRFDPTFVQLAADGKL